MTTAPALPTTLLSLLAATSCAAADPATNPSTTQNHPARYLALGDSYTIGEGVPESARWPVQLAAALNAAGIPCAPPHIIARTGWTTDEMLRAVDAEYPATAPGAGGLSPVFDLVTLLIGVNDQYRGRTPDQFSHLFPTCLDRAILMAGGHRDHVVVVAFPDYGYTPFGMGGGAGVHAGVAAFDAIAKQLSSAPIGYADILPVSCTVPQHADWIGPDGLHPTQAQYAAWTAVVLPKAIAALTGKSPAVSATTATPTAP